jgi:hypothetical protein
MAPGCRQLDLDFQHLGTPVEALVELDPEQVLRLKGFRRPVIS